MEEIQLLKEKIRRLKISHAKIAIEIGESRDVVSNILNGRTKPNSYILEKIVAYLSNNYETDFNLLEGKMNTVEDIQSNYLTKNDKYISELLTVIEYKDQEIRLLKEILESRNKIIELLENKAKTPDN